MRNRKWLLWSLVAGCILGAGAANAQLLINPVLNPGDNRSSMGAAFAKSRIDYDFEITREFESTVIGGSFQHGIKKNLQIFGEVGFINEIEIEKFNDEGKGFLFGGGAKGEVYRKNQFSTHLYGLLAFMQGEIDNLGESNEDLEFNVMELQLGVLAGYDVAPELNVFGGIELVPFSDGKIELLGDKEDLERDDLLTLRLGTSFRFTPQAALHASFAMAGESAIVIGADVVF